MAINKILYPIDLTGKSATNQIKDEPHVIGTDRYRAFALNYGPFFAQSIVVMDVDKHRRLVRGVDFETLYTIPELVKATRGQEVAGVLIITNKNVSTNISVTYNIVGGHYCSNVYVIEKAISDLNLDNRNAYWKNILEKPELFQPAPHDHDFGDVYGFEYIISLLASLNNAIIAGNSQVTDKIQETLNKAISDITKYIDSHKSDHGNPHHVTAEQVNCFDKQEVNKFLDGISKRFEALEPRISEIIKDIAANAQAIAAQATVIDKQGDRIGDVERTASNMNLLVSNVNDRCDAILKDIAGVKDSIKLLQQRDVELTEAIDDVKTSVTAVNKRVDGVLSTIETLHTTDGHLQQQIDALTNAKNDLYGKHNAQQNTLNSHGNSISDLYNKHNAQQGSINDLYNKISQVGNRPVHLHYRTGRDSINGLQAGGVYMVTVYGIVHDRGNSNIGQMQVRNSGGSILASTNVAWVNWPDGQPTQFGTLIITAPSNGYISGHTDVFGGGGSHGTTLNMTAVRIS